MNFSRPTKSDLRSLLGKVLTPEQGRMLRMITEQAAHLRLPLYIVGGFVRDLLLGHPGLDFDLVVEGDAIGMARAVAGAQGGKVIAHPRFKTAQWFPPSAPGIPGFIDFISTRKESYSHPAALPTVRAGTISDDLRRRDFTLNTLALRLDGEHYGELTDELGGLEDLQAGLVRVLHPKSFENDPTRLFRMARYEIRYGLKVAPKTLSLVQEALPFIDLLSPERVRHELDLILVEESSAPILKRLGKLGVLAAVHPALEWNQAIQIRFVNGMASEQTLKQPPSRSMLGWTLWLMAVPSPGMLSLEKRLHFDSALRDILISASALFFARDNLSEKKASQCVFFLEKYPLKAIQAVALGLPAGQIRKTFTKYLETWRTVRPKTTGHDLKKRGLPPGPEYKTILRKLRAGWLDGEVKTAEDEALLLDQLIKNQLRT